ncbi:MAG: bifunctional nuclease family protein [Bacteroidales bacterium]|nr:bifunctional nuclease family protein [Bacteroidales bacterium]
MKKIRLKIAGLSYSQTRHGAYALILEEEDGNRRLPVIIGTSEAQSIAIQLEGLKPFRPLTHDLFVNMANSFRIEVVEVNIVKLEEGIFYSEIICKKEHTKIKIDSRTSDAIAIALRFHAPIFVKESIIDKAGMMINEDIQKTSSEPSKDKSDEKRDYKSLSDKELKKMMQEAINNEDYETASKIRDELKKRKEK